MTVGSETEGMVGCGSFGSYSYHYCPGRDRCFQKGIVYGAGPHYTSDSPKCLAAIHAGFLPKEGGFFKVISSGKRANFTSSTANGITTTAWTNPEPTYTVTSCDLDLQPRTAQVCGEVILYYCRGIAKCTLHTPAKKVLGSQPYPLASFPCLTAVHAGVINALTGGVFFMYPVNQTNFYPGSDCKGITSYSCSGSAQSYMYAPVEGYNNDNNNGQCGVVYQQGHQIYCVGRDNGCNFNSSVWGSNPYTYDSCACAVGVHAGRIGMFIIIMVHSLYYLLLTIIK